MRPIRLLLLLIAVVPAVVPVGCAPAGGPSRQDMQDLDERFRATDRAYAEDMIEMRSKIRKLEGELRAREHPGMPADPEGAEGEIRP